MLSCFHIFPFNNTLCWMPSLNTNASSQKSYFTHKNWTELRCLLFMFPFDAPHTTTGDQWILILLGQIQSKCYTLFHSSLNFFTCFNTKTYVWNIFFSKTSQRTSLGIVFLSSYMDHCFLLLWTPANAFSFKGRKISWEYLCCITEHDSDKIPTLAYHCTSLSTACSES